MFGEHRTPQEIKQQLLEYYAKQQSEQPKVAESATAREETKPVVEGTSGGDEQKQVAEHKPAQNFEQEVEQPPVQKPKQEPVAKQENAENVAQHAKKAWDLFQYENGQISDVIEYVNDNIPKSETTQALYDAIDKYEQEDEEDRNLWGRRGDLEPYRDAILDELERLSKQEVEQQAREAELSDAGVRYSIVTDPKLIDKLESGEKIKVYRAMAMVDGKLYPPMSSKDNSTGQLRQPIELEQWEQSEENLDKAKIKNGKYYFDLKQADGRVTGSVAYNPYFHTSRSPLNDQFSAAYDKPYLVTVETEIPASELTSGYHAEGAHNAVGEVDWKSGGVSGQIAKQTGNRRKVILSRWAKPVRIIPEAEVAEKISQMLEGTDIAIPNNVVTPALLEALEKQGVKIDYEGIEREKNKASKSSKKQGAGVRYSINLEQVNEQFNNELQQQIDGTLPKGHIYQLGNPSEILQDYGFPNMPIELSAAHLAEKAKAAHHQYSLEEVRDLVKAIHNPIAIFRYGDATKAQNVIIEFEHEGKNFVVGVHFNQQRRGNVVSDIRGLYPKDNAEWLNWILQDKALYLNKEKIQTLIDQQRRTLAEVDYLDLNLLAKVIENFDNNKHKVNNSTKFSIAMRDKEYAEAVANGDIAKAQQMLRDEAERKGYSPRGNYRDAHRSPSASVDKKDFTNIEALRNEVYEYSGDSNLLAVAQGVHLQPEDYFSPQGAHWYGYDDADGMEAYHNLKNAIGDIQQQISEFGEVRNMPTIKVYRAVPKEIKGDQFESEGQWVSPSRQYAVNHGRHRFGYNKYRIIEQAVPADELWWDGNDIREWGFDDGTQNVYKNTRNNRKLFDITYDDNGNLIPLSKRFNQRNDDIRFSISNHNNDIFYSNAERAVEGIKQDKATPQQWLAMIDKAGGLKAGEDKWLGLSDWLKSFEIGDNETPSEAIARNNKRTITKQEILDFIRQNKIQIEEVRYDESQMPPAFPNNFRLQIEKQAEELYNSGMRRYDYIEDKTERQDKADEYARKALEREYGQDVMYYVSFGWDNEYDEVRAVRTGTDMDFYEFALQNWSKNNQTDARPVNSTRLVYTTNGLTNKREIALVVPTIESWNENDEIHFGDAGEGRAIAWVRFGDTTDEQGNKVLVIDEIQSKRHQEGREKGYREGELSDTEKQEKELREQLKAIRQRINEIIPADINGIHARYEFSKNLPEGLKEELTTLREDESRLVIEISNLKSARTDYQRQIPAAPFEKNWHELAFKRMLRFAAENGYDKVAWTTGEQQAERYDLGNVVNHIDVYPHTDTKDRQVIIKLNRGDSIDLSVDEKGVVENGEYRGKHLSDVVGKALADKLLSSEQRASFRGDNLRIGGEGMKGFYDDMLPRFVSKYAKKWDAKVGEVTMPELQDGYQTMHSVDITEPMKESVMQGQALFSTKMKDNQGNPLNADGTLKVEKVTSIEELTDKDFTQPYRNVQLPELAKPINDAIGAKGKSVIIKKNIFEKQQKSHTDLTPDDSRVILQTALYNPNLYGQNQKITRPNNWILIHIADKNTAVILEIADNKEYVEIISWHYLNDYGVQKKENQAIKEGGQILKFTTNPAANTANDSLISDDKVTTNDLNTQELGDIFAIAGQPEFREIDDDETLSEYASRYHEWLQQQKDIALFEHYWHDYARRNVNEGKKRLDDQIEEDWFNAELSIERFQDFLKDIGGKVTTNVAHFVWQARGKQTYQQNQVKRNLIYPLMSTVKDLEKLIGTKRGKDTKLHLRWQNLDESKVGRRYKRNGTPVTARELIGLYLQAKDIDECEKLGLPSRGAEGFYNNLLKFPTNVL